MVGLAKIFSHALPVAALLFVQVALAQQVSPPGSIDRTFKSSGYFRYNEGAPFTILFAPDGKIYIGGFFGSTAAATVSMGPSPSLQIIRLNSDGTLDQSFGQKGAVSDTTCAGPESMQLDPQGNLIALSNRNSLYQNCSIRRFSNDGTPDTAFNSKVRQSIYDGRYTFDDQGNLFFIRQHTDSQLTGPNTNDVTASIDRISSDGTVTGTISIDDNSPLSLFFAGMVPDVATNHNGIFWLSLQKHLAIVDQSGKYKDLGDFSQYGTVHSIQFQSNGTLILTDRAIIKLGPDYQLDRSFGESGMINGDFQSIDIDRSDRIFATSSEGTGDPETDITCFSRLGKIDPSFGISGVFSMPEFAGIALRSSRSAPFRLLIAGVEPEPGTDWGPLNPKEWAVYGLTEDGRYDKAFGLGLGVEGLSVEVAPGRVSPITAAVAVQPDGGVLHLVSYGDASGDNWLYRLDPDGTIDPKFGVNGATSVLKLDALTYTVGGSLLDIKSQADGRFLLTGTLSHRSSSQPSSSEIFVKRFLSNGALDLSYGKGGFASIFTGGCLPQDYDTCQYQLITSSVGSDGSLFLVAVERNMPNPLPYTDSYFVARVGPDGSLDQKFGKVVLPLAIVGGILTLSDGRLFVYGVQLEGGQEKLSLVRMNADGTLDSSFGTNGLAAFGADTLAHDGRSSMRLSYRDAKETFDYGVVFRIDRANDDSLVCPSLIKIDSKGTIDRKFGNGGYVPLNGGCVYLTSGTTIPGNWLLTPANGRVLVVGTTDIDAYSSDGSLDPTFGNNGHLHLQDFSQPFALITGAFLTPNGELLYYGDYSIPDGYGNKFALARFWL